ncbi:AraC family transcriptional regulator [Luteimonas sp. RD2P54]|uniref:AraC family transcriptional regulator n=1 Tax=Luteimonas endophytica TaxID=3042023 RepID=A0ABT6JDT2_9GAMM|nr:AraC family transcriptional regulator [Luteimonas endophytica]MDH5824979.1 AraC family transcriptional regulator [Luteimonas endophytica]
MCSPCYETRHDAGGALATHRHRAAYVALVVDGSHVECSVDGAWDCEPGTLVVHPPWHAHGNRFGRGGARVANAQLPGPVWCGTGAFLAPDAREARELLLRAPQHLPALLEASAPLPRRPLQRWQPAFLEALARDDRPVGEIAADLGVSFAHASRSFARSHGQAPQALRGELRWRRALLALAGDAPLASIATGVGYADQSHMTRAFRLRTGAPPSRLRRQLKSVQDGAGARLLQSRA